MEPKEQPQKPWWLNKEILTVIEKFSMLILCIYLLYWIKKMDDEKTKLQQQHIESLLKQLEDKERVKQVTDKIYNEIRHTNNNSNTTDPHEIGE